MIEYDVKKMYEWPFPAQALIIVLISCFIIYIGYLLDLTPLNSKIKIEIEKEKNLKEQLKTNLLSGANVSASIKQIPMLKNKLNQWKKNVIPTQDLQNLLDQLLKLGESLQLKFNIFNPQTPIKKDGYTIVAVKISVVGTYDQLASYISEIANMSKIVVIGNFTFRKNEEITPSTAVETSTTPEKTLTADLTLEILQT